MVMDSFCFLTKWSIEEMKQIAETSQLNLGNAVHACKPGLLRQQNLGISDHLGVSAKMILTGGLPIREALTRPVLAAVGSGATTLVQVKA